MEEKNYYYLIHPLDDEPEEKCCVDDLGPMTMTRSVRWSLFALQGYLILMGILLLYHVLDLAGLFKHS